MRVRVIGSGNMTGKHNSACYLVDDDIMVDFPNGACKYLYRSNINPDSINNILITHFHGDHYFDLPFYVMNKSKSDTIELNIYCSKEGKRKINKITKLAFPNSYKNAFDCLNYKYDFSDDFIINGYKVKKLLVDHGRMKPAYGFIFNKDNITFGFTGDSTLCANYEYMASVCKYLFCDCMFINGTTKHMGIDMLKGLCDKYPNCTFIVSHLEDDTREEFKKINIKNVLVPDDGAVIEIK